MIFLSRIYTKTGDKGQTSLGDGQKRSKGDLRIEAIGSVDEANASIGVARQFIPKDIDPLLSRIQNDLFDLGADLCVPEGEGLRIQDSQVIFLEKTIDQLNEPLPPLHSFVLPAGKSSFMHLARTIVRRAERSVVTLHESEPVNPEAIKYLNRLSDLLFVLCRLLNEQGKEDVLWVPGENR